MSNELIDKLSDDIKRSKTHGWNSVWVGVPALQSLLAERDADKALIAELKNDVDAANARVDAGCAQLCKQDELIATLRDACSQWERKAISNFEECAEMSARIEELESQRKLAFTASNRWADKFRDAEKRIAELESRTLTVKLPPKVDSSNVPFAAHAWNSCIDEVSKRLAAAGITLVAGE